MRNGINILYRKFKDMIILFRAWMINRKKMRVLKQIESLLEDVEEMINKDKGWWNTNRFKNGNCPYELDDWYKVRDAYVNHYIILRKRVLNIYPDDDLLDDLREEGSLNMKSFSQLKRLVRHLHSLVEGDLESQKLTDIEKLQNEVNEIKRKMVNIPDIIIESQTNDSD